MRILSLCFAVLALLVVPSGAGAAGLVHVGKGQGLAAFDARAAALSGATANDQRPRVAAAQSALRGTLGRQAAVDADPLTGGARLVARLNGFLTGPSTADAADIALGYVRDHLAAFGLSEADLAGLSLAERTDFGSTVHLVWSQTARGIGALDNGLTADVGRDGRLLQVGGSPRAGLAAVDASPALGPAAGLAAAMRSVGAPVGVAPAAGPSRGADRHTTFSNGDSDRLTYFGETGTHARLAWRALVHTSSTEVYDVVVDADTGQLLRRSNLVKFASAKVLDNYPGAASGGASTIQDITSLVNGPTSLSGPNAHVVSDPNDAITGPGSALAGATEIAPGTYDPVSFTGTGTTCPSPGCTWKPATASSWLTNTSQAGNQLFWFVNRFHDHLAAPPIDFTAADGNFEGADPIVAQVNDGANTNGGVPNSAHVNNANMTAYPDGTPGFMQMYLFRSPFDAVNGADEGAIVYHEYTHGLSNRLVHDVAGYGALDLPQSGALGEAWSDWYAMDFLNADGYQPDVAGTRDVRFGAYVGHGHDYIRTQPMDCHAGDTSGQGCPGGSGSGQGGYTYGDYGRIFSGGPEVHADGEIWGETLWQIRQAFIARDGASAGITHAELVITDGMRLTPPQPSFLDARNAILLADVNDRGAADLSLLWTVFAQRGMGYLADTTSAWDGTPTESFAMPPSGTANASLAGKVVDDVGAAVSGAQLQLGGSLGGMLGDLTATSNASGLLSLAAFVPSNAYHAVYTANGYGLLDLAAAPDAGASAGDAVLLRDLAQSGTATQSGGTDYTSYGCGPAAAIDGSYRTTLSVRKADAPTITITLPASATVGGFGIVTGGGCGDDIDNGAASMTLATSTNGSSYTTVTGVPTLTAGDNYKRVFVGLPSPRSGVVKIRMTLTAPQNAAAVFIDVPELEVYPTLPSAAPTASTLAAVSHTDTSATVTGAVDGMGGVTVARYEYGPTTAYGFVSDPVVVPAGTTSAPVSLTGLASSKTYHYRLVAAGARGVVRGGDQTVTTDGAPAPKALVSVTALDFPTTAVGSTAPAQQVTITNGGSDTMIVGTLAVSGSGQASFALPTGDPGSCAQGLPLAPDASCYANVVFAPDTPGSRSASLDIPSNAPTKTVSLTGVGGTATASVSPATLDFGNVATNAGFTRSVVVANTGNATMTIGTPTIDGTGADSYLLPDSGVGGCSTIGAIGAGGTCKVKVTFAPSDLGSHPAALHIPGSQTNGTRNVALAGNGVVPPVVNAGPPTTIEDAAPAASAPDAPPAASPTAAPTPIAKLPVGRAPVIRLATQRTGVARLAVDCSLACSATGTLAAGTTLAKQLHLRRGAIVGRATRRLAAGSSVFEIRMTSKLLAKLRRAHVRWAGVVLKVAATDAADRRGASTRVLRVRLAR